MYYLRLPFLGMALLLLLNSCERHSIIEPLDPHQDLKQWYAFSRMTPTNEPVLWNYTTPFTMPDGSQAFQIPVMSKSGMKDLIIYSENGVLKGFYKWYTPKDETHINVQVLNMFDEVIRDGVLTKTKRVIMIPQFPLFLKEVVANQVQRKRKLFSTLQKNYCFQSGTTSKINAYFKP